MRTGSLVPSKSTSRLEMYASQWMYHFYSNTYWCWEEALRVVGWARDLSGGQETLPFGFIYDNVFNVPDTFLAWRLGRDLGMRNIYMYVCIYIYTSRAGMFMT